MILSLRDLRLIVQSVLALAHFLPLFLLWLRRLGERGGRLFTGVYCVLSALWAVGSAVSGHHISPSDVWFVRVASYIGADLPASLVALLLAIACLNLDHRGRWVWGGVGLAWLGANLGLQLYFKTDLLSARSAGIAGWAVVSALTVFLSAWWTLRATLAFYRNRGIYWLVLLVLFIGGQGLVWIGGQWVEIALAMHLVGAVGVMLYTASHNLPNIKGLLRSATSATMLTVATALLLMVGLAAGWLLFRIWDNLYISIVGSVVLAVVLALIYHPFHRFIARLVNRLLWRGGYDPSEVMREYGRTISKLLTLEQLTTVAMGTINEVLEVHRGALIVISRAEQVIALRAMEGMGPIDDKEGSLALDSPILLHMMMTGEPFYQYDLEHHPQLRMAPPHEKAWFTALGMEIFIPILARERLLGILGLGPLGKGEPYGPAELDFLATLAQQTGVALQNAYLFNEMRGLYARITRLNEDLRQAYGKLKKLDQAKTDFLSISSHELRTPLTVIQGYMGIIEELADAGSLAPAQVKEIMENLKPPVNRLGTIVTAMLDASAIEINALDLHFTSTTLQATLSMALGPWHEAMKERNLNLAMEGIEDIPPISIDVQRVCQAFSNMISNAIKYTPDNGQVTIRANLAEDGKNFEIVIADTGVGIAPENHTMIFEKFYRVGDLLRHSTGDTKFMGAGPGLGLHIAKGVVEAHGGRIWVESEGYDEQNCPGSEFHVVLPLQANPVDRAEESFI